MVVLMPLFAAEIVDRCASQVLHRCAQSVSRGAARCASQVNGRGAHAYARGATHVLDRGVCNRKSLSLKPRKTRFKFQLKVLLKSNKSP
jgi:hypothetical protein